MANQKEYVEYMVETGDIVRRILTVELATVEVRNSCCDLIGKDLEEIPVSSITRLRNLVSLDLSYNDITYIPQKLVLGLPELRHFCIAHNQVKYLPFNIGLWVKLETLYVHNNKIKNLPEMRGLVKLVRLNLRGNPLLKLWKTAFGDEWDLACIEKAASFARDFYKSTGLTEAEVNKRGSGLLDDPKFQKIMIKSGLPFPGITTNANNSSTSTNVPIEKKDSFKKQ